MSFDYLSFSFHAVFLPVFILFLPFPSFFFPFLSFFSSSGLCRGVLFFIYTRVPPGSPSSGGYVAVYVFNINQPSLATAFYSVLVSVSLFMTLSTVFHFINSSDNSLFSYSVLPILILPYWSFQLCISLGKSPSALI